MPVGRNTNLDSNVVAMGIPGLNLKAVVELGVQKRCTVCQRLWGCGGHKLLLVGASKGVSPSGRTTGHELQAGSCWQRCFLVQPCFIQHFARRFARPRPCQPSDGQTVRPHTLRMFTPCSILPSIHRAWTRSPISQPSMVNTTLNHTACLQTQWA